MTSISPSPDAVLGPRVRRERAGGQGEQAQVRSAFRIPGVLQGTCREDGREGDRAEILWIEGIGDVIFGVDHAVPRSP